MSADRAVRFYLDNDTDAACCEVVRNAGHEEVWTTAQAGRARAADDDQAVYAADKGAVLVSHDKEFARRQRKNTGCQMIFLNCSQPDGPEVLGAWLSLIEEPLRKMPLVVIELRPESYVVHGPQWD